MSYEIWSYAIGAAIGAALSVYVYFASKNLYEEDDHDDDYSGSSSLRPICAACCEQIPQTDAILLSCNHLFHENCIDNLKKRSSSCPQCGKRINF